MKKYLSFLLALLFFSTVICYKTTIISKAASKDLCSQKYSYDPGTLLDNFDNTDNWVASSSGTKSVDKINVKSGSSNLRLTVNNPGDGAYIDKTCSLNVSDLKTISFWVYIPDKSKLLAISADLISNNFASSFSANITKWSLTNGWNHVKFAKSDFTSSGNANWNTPITTLRLWVWSDSQKSADVTFGEMRKNEKSTPQVIVVMDDGYSSVYNKMYPYFKARNIPVSVCAIKNSVNTDGYMTDSQLKTLYNSGWDVINHTTNHTALNSLPDSGIANEITTCSTYLNNLGFIKSSNILAYPEGLGADDLHVQDVLKNSGIVMARGSIVGLVNTPVDNAMSLKSALEMTNTTTLADVKTTIDKAIESGSTAIIFSHNVSDSPSSDTYTVPTSLVKGLADYIVSTGIKPLTLSSFELEQAIDTPSLTSTFNNTSFTTDDNIAIPYTIASANLRDSFTATYTIDGRSTSSKALSSGNNTWNIGKLSAGNHSLSITARNSSGKVSNILNFSITVNASKPPSIITDGLVLWLDGSDGSRNQKVWYDKSGHNNNFTLMNFNYNITSGWQGDSLKFDGIDDYCFLPNTDSLNIKGKNITIEYVMKKASADNGVIIGKNYKKSFFTNITSQAFFFSRDAFCSSQANVADNKKHYIVCRMQNGKTDIWVDSIIKNTTYGGKMISNNTDIDIGRNPINGYGHFKGNIYTIRVYNRALTDKEIINNYNLSK